MKYTWLFIIGIFLLSTGCTSEQLKTTELTIEPYEVNKHEKELIVFTGIEGIQYFELNGEVGKADDLLKTIEVYEHGKKVSDEPFSSNQIQDHFKDSLLSFGFDSDKGEIRFIHGSEGGTFTMLEDFEASGYTFGSLQTEKVMFEHNKPVYLYAIAGTNKGGISGVTLDEEGKPSGGILQADKAFVFKVMVTNRTSE
ncbi:hypothetical protein FGG79_18850 [Bacillus sp. BHET2]|uniref:hypothetical protein n=1 Tax=Bacillus sp. BHET2 TaxID=2583818 RepID=UPI00110D7695|nr:hypothetical protein [Bacillus sp. BHET2]TMU83758.1 hypothetical protein FGG79_18850 [Bacillus sp. BHET2]